MTSFQSGFKFGLGLSPQNRVDGAQRMSDDLPDNCGWGAMHEPAHFRGATSNWFSHKSGLFLCTASLKHAKLPGTTVCLRSHHVVQIHDGQCLSNQKTQPTTPWSFTDSSVLFLVEETLSLYAWLKQLKYLCKMFTKFAAKFHTHTHTRCSSSSIIVTLSPIRRTACACAQFSSCSSTTNANSETGQMAVCSQNLMLGALSSCSTLSLLVGVLFKKVGLFLNNPRICVEHKQSTFQSFWTIIRLVFNNFYFQILYRSLMKHLRDWNTLLAYSIQISRPSAHEGGKGVSPMHQPPLPPRKYSWYSFVLEAESIPGPQCGRKDYVNEKFQWHHWELNLWPSGL